MTTMEGRNITQKKWVNSNLISLKCLLFFFFGGIGCLFPFLPLHMIGVGLTIEEAKIISVVSPIVALIGPLCAGPIADRLAGRQGSNDRASTGRYLRVMISVVCILGAVFYSVLVAIPRVQRITIPQERRPHIRFTCDQSGAVIYKERCKIPATCYELPEIRAAPIQLKDCHYKCNSLTVGAFGNFTIPEQFTGQTINGTEFVDESESDGVMTVAPIDSGDDQLWDKPDKSPESYSRKARYVNRENEPPHLCVKENGYDVCYVYTEFSFNMTINTTVQQSINPEEITEQCAYPLTDHFSCRIPKQLVEDMTEFNKSCFIECDLNNPYGISGSIFEDAGCQQVIGNPEFTFWIYLTVRSLADIFPTTAVALLDAAVVIATRETSCGRGDVGQQLAFGSLGFAVFGSLSGFFTNWIEGNPSSYSVPVDIFAVLMILSAVISLCANGMPLSPPEWWWHTRSGMLALPMSAVKRYTGETAALLFVLMIMGTFWSSMDTYLPWHLIQLNANAVLVGVCLTIGAIPAIIFLWKSEHLVDYCGHSNLLITAFTIYIVRFTGLSLVSGNPWWSLASEVLELFTLGIMWVTAILYLRHLVPRHLTVTAQALPVIAHFCIGRCIGAIISAYVDVARRNVDSLRFVYQCMAVAAAIIALIYFTIYHALLKPKCHAQSTHGPRQPPTIMEAMNGNGNYTPLRVYHNGRGRKGQFRY
ncbi:uncharacterized protein LOC110116776 [Athalia rosae]|uniref:uncharacterized protein LOC110116776 n=1 Tax=Athalia rosae TaxID=37344 RepID=UPI0020349658|nr:uncharacterized protein LOC110116776 [Athalia rosae]XP_012261491.2 uncharacterized protein LOC110116776 [Athalia rosae]XP_048513746.1 uncharacterized protein LOC110116776 [Athalia rosae]XP_048513747.1 uncharacterized protein LOC110116776 [Athalia rosae]